MASERTISQQVIRVGGLQLIPACINAQILAVGFTLLFPDTVSGLSNRLFARVYHHIKRAAGYE
jgi:UDP-N-acetylglucosamine:LPS N-acetylglucosamine transferase